MVLLTTFTKGKLLIYAIVPFLSFSYIIVQCSLIWSQEYLYVALMSRERKLKDKSSVFVAISLSVWLHVVIISLSFHMFSARV